MKTALKKLSQQEQLNFLITNRVPRRFLTQAMGHYSKIKSRRLTRFSIALWQLFADDLNLAEAKKQKFDSLQDCFTRELKKDARPVDPCENTVVSPCDAIVGSCGRIHGSTVFQAKGFPYDLDDLLPDTGLQHKYLDGTFITLRLKSSMYHRFHAPVDCNVRQVTYISGDTWNVNPIALSHIEKLYCKNERAVVELENAYLPGSITLVPVAAILVASMKFHCLTETLSLSYKGPNTIPCNAFYHKGDEMGYFQHGSTIILLATSDYRLMESITEGMRINMGQPLLSLSTAVH